jgi:enoyl-CoA hydratase
MRATDAPDADDDLLVDQPLSGVLRLTLNRPETLNALTFGLIDRVINELEALRFDLSVRVVILTGSGRGFCSGHDRNDHEPPPWLPFNLGGIHKSTFILQRMSSLVPLMHSLPQPVIAAVNGATAGFGYSMVLGCDIALAADTAFFVNGFHNVGGGGAEGGMSYLLPRAIGTQRAAELLLTGRRVGAEEAARMGLVTRTVPGAELTEAAIQMARDIMEMPPLAVAQTKAALWNNSQLSSLQSALDLEIKGQILAQQTEDAREKKAAVMDRRPPVFRNL